MSRLEIYDQIATRMNGDIYVGVVGPVRTGKSTFITKFMNTLVIPKMADNNSKLRTIDELPQSGAGKTIMTMQPRFVPNEAVKIDFDKNVSAYVRLVDCVGYLIDGIEGDKENNKPRMIKTPWSDQKITFNDAAEIGTNKVITEHSTIGVLVTTDGTITDIERQNYIEAEEKAVAELKKIGKPFVIVLNSVDPLAEQTEAMRVAMSKKYDATVISLNVEKMTEQDALNVLQSVLYEFPIKKINVDLPLWMQSLPVENETISYILKEISAVSCKVMKDFKVLTKLFSDNADIEEPVLKEVDLATGELNISVRTSSELFYKTLSEITGKTLANDLDLINFITNATFAKKQYDKISAALEEAESNGYGVVVPSLDEMTFKDPEIVKRGNNGGIKLKATASSLHIVKVDVETEVTPAVGGSELSAEQIESMINSSDGAETLWNTKMFGKTLTELAHDGIVTKIQTFPEEARTKLNKTISKITNEGKGGILCILL